MQSNTWLLCNNAPGSEDCDLIPSSLLKGASETIITERKSHAGPARLHPRWLLSGAPLCCSVRVFSHLYIHVSYHWKHNFAEKMRSLKCANGDWKCARVNHLLLCWALTALFSPSYSEPRNDKMYIRHCNLPGNCAGVSRGLIKIRCAYRVGGRIRMNINPLEAEITELCYATNIKTRLGLGGRGRRILQKTIWPKPPGPRCSHLKLFQPRVPLLLLRRPRVSGFLELHCQLLMKIREGEPVASD